MASQPTRPLIVGREAEKQRLTLALTSTEPELVAIYGRRRIGKTFLVREHLHDRIVFELTGLHGEPMDRQLENFAFSLSQFTGSRMIAQPTSWLTAIEQIKQLVEIKALERGGKLVLFFDEFRIEAKRIRQ